ncbi:MAG: hypothetical protein SCH98_13535 [Deferrisomatales bacterium]|nr:hypothetical protein [Deferrisomatales bacterium]
MTRGDNYLDTRRYQRYQLDGAQLTLAGNTVTTAVTLAGLAMQLNNLPAEAGRLDCD